MPGTRPARRSARAAPLPARGRAVAVIARTVAMTINPLQISLYAHPLLASVATCVCRNGKGRSCGHSWRRLITGPGANDKETSLLAGRSRAALPQLGLERSDARLQ